MPATTKKKLYLARVRPEGAGFAVAVDALTFDAHGTGFERKEHDLPTGLNGVFASELPKLGGFTKNAVLAADAKAALLKLMEVYRARRNDAAAWVAQTDAELRAIEDALTGAL